MDLSLQDHMALVVGGASGIGLATAELFAEEGAHVAIWDLSPSAPAVAERLGEKFSVRSLGITLDISRHEAVQGAVAATTEALGGLDHLVHAAAIGSGRFGFPFTNLRPDDWSRVLEVNVLGVTHVAHAIAPLLIDRGGGTMVFVASIAGQIGSQTDPPYSASKAANINFAQCMAKDLAHDKVRVNTVCPGMVQTPLNRSVWQAWHDQASPEEQLSYEDWAQQKIERLVPLRTWQTPQAVADMIVFLSSRRAEHITGQTINVDGGMVMHC